MASLVAKGSCSSSSSSQLSGSVMLQAKGLRNKRKFRADLSLGDPNKIIPLLQNECPSYEFSAEKFDSSLDHEQCCTCDMCSVATQDHSDGLKLELGLSSSGVGSSEFEGNWPWENLEVDEFQEADWSDLTETQLEELVLSNLEMIFQSAIKKIVSCGYTEEVATKAVLRSGLCFGCKDTVSNIVDNTLAFLRNGQELDPLREHSFEDLQQLQKYMLAELVCVLREVRPFFSTGDAMWCLLICDMNVSHACAMDSDPSNSFIGDGAPNGIFPVSSEHHLKTEGESSELSLSNPCEPIPAVPFSHISQSDARSITEVANITKPKKSLVQSELVTDKENANSASDTLHRSFSVKGTSQSFALEEKFACNSRKVNSSSTKKEYILRQKSLHLDKNYRAYGSKGSSRAAKLSGLILDKKLKSVCNSTVSLKSASLKISATMGVDLQLDNGNRNLTTNSGSSSPATFNQDAVNSSSSLPKTNIQSALPIVKSPTPLPAANIPPALLTADTELSLSLTAKRNQDPVCLSCSAEVPHCSLAGVPYDKSLGQWIPQDKKDVMIKKLFPKARELQNLLEDWNEWAHQKVMQATRRLSKDKAELKTLRQEKEEVERLKKEKQTLEENTMKKLSEMENALSKASGQVEQANSAVRRLEVDNSALRQEMEAAKLRAAESAVSCQEVSKREKKTLTKVQSWDKQKIIFQEELITEKRKVAQLIQEVEKAKVFEAHFVDIWNREEKEREDLQMQANSIRKEREQSEASMRSIENMVKLNAENSLLKYKADIKRLEKEISQLRLKTDSPKIAALRKGIDGSFAKVTDISNGPTPKESRAPYISDAVTDFHHDHTETAVKRERECVMCLSEEMSVVFLPCAHQVVCTTCNELHEKQGMKDCPSCRSPIQRRIPVSYARS